MPARSRHCEWGATPNSVLMEPLSRHRDGKAGRSTDPRVRKPVRDRTSSPFRAKRTGLMKRLRSVLIIPLLVAPHAHAQERKTLEPVVVTATKIEEPAERLGAVVTIITQDDLARHNYPTIADALRDVPGVEVQRSGSLGKLTELRIRRATPPQGP